MIIFSPGPANISERVRLALNKPDICHRDAEFGDLLSSIRKLLLEAYELNNDYESVIFSGSGTLAIESVISSFGNYDKKILIISNGVYGERAAGIARAYNISFEELSFKWGELPELSKIENALKKETIGAVYVVHHETTTGLLNPLKEISAIAKKYDKLILTDAVSSFAGEDLDIKSWGLDAVIGSANKCIRGIPGASFAIISRRFINTIIKNCESRSFYANLRLHLEAENKNETPFTPAVQTFYAFEEALKELLDEGLENRIKKYQEISRILRTGLKNISLKLYLPEELMSNTMTLVQKPAGFNFSAMHENLKKSGFVIYASQGKLSNTTFRLGTVGIITPKNIHDFINAFKEIL